MTRNTRKYTVTVTYVPTGVVLGTKKCRRITGVQRFLAEIIEMHAETNADQISVEFVRVMNDDGDTRTRVKGLTETRAYREYSDWV